MKISRKLRHKILTELSDAKFRIEPINIFGMSKRESYSVPGRAEVDDDSCLLKFSQNEEFDLIQEMLEWFDSIWKQPLTSPFDYKIDIGPFVGLFPASFNKKNEQSFMREILDMYYEFHFNCDWFDPDRQNWRDWF